MLMQHSDQYLSILLDLQKTSFKGQQHSLSNESKVNQVVLDSYEFIDRPEELHFITLLSII